VVLSSPAKTELCISVLMNNAQGMGLQINGEDLMERVWYSRGGGGGWLSACNGRGEFGFPMQNQAVGLGFEEQCAGGTSFQ
jgi:hypothetical protein